ncbi:MAG: DNA repair protein RecO [Gammaproteobacteria bacterium]|nr:DNA repair protein RecO [Gammaproteobacteria bacterium]
MSRSAGRVLLASAYVLHQRPFRDTSLIVEIFTREHGRLTTFARGARGARPRFAGLRPFQPLLLSFSGRGEAAQLTAAEPDGVTPPLPAPALLGAFYLNELLVRLTERHDAHPELFDAYAATLAGLRAGRPLEPLLRRFEKQLLDLVGFGIELAADASGAAVAADAYYHFVPERGLLGATAGAAGACPGHVLLTLAAEQLLEDATDLRAARGLLRAALDHCLDGRELSTRAVARSVARLEKSL